MIGADQAQASAAATALYEAEAEAVYGYARARLSPQEAEDVTSEVFHAAMVALTDGRARQVNGAWLMVVARNKVIDRWRRRSSDRNKRDRIKAERNVAEVLDEWATADRRAAVLAALDQLPHHYRTALVMRHLDGHAIRTIAESLSVSVAAAESTLARARRAFRAAYGSNDE